VFLGADELVKMIDAIDKARWHVGTLLCERTPFNCTPDATVKCSVCVLRWALAEVVRD
jgi:hypothetical protein